MLALLIVLLDQLSKNYIFNNKELFLLGKEVFNNLDIVFVINKGISFGLLSEYDISFYLGILSFLISIVIIYWIILLEDNYDLLAFNLILGGAIGNGYDRVMNSYVIDFIDFHIFGYHWPSFNLADASITIGAIIYLLNNIFSKNI